MLKQRREGEENNNNYNNGYNGYNGYFNDTYYMDERELLAYHQKVVSYVFLALSLAFFTVSACLYSGGQILPETGSSRSIRRIQEHANITFQFDHLSEMWSFLSLCTIVIFVALFVAACTIVGGEDAERMMEEGKVINLVIVLVWMIIVTITMLAWGNEVFSIRSTGSLGVGMLYGGTKYFASLLIMVCLLFANLSLDEGDREEEGSWAASATCITCLILSVFHLFFSLRTRNYQVSVIDSNSSAEQDTVLDPNSGMVHSTTGNFVRMDEPGMQMTRV